MQLLDTELVSSSVKKKENITTIDLTKPMFAKLTDIAKKHAKSTRQYGMHLVNWNLAKYGLLERIYPNLSKDHIGNKSIFIVDSKIRDKTIEVKFEYLEPQGNKDKVIFKCLHCNKSDCMHCIFSLMLPEVGQLAIDNKIMEDLIHELEPQQQNQQQHQQKTRKS